MNHRRQKRKAFKLVPKRKAWGVMAHQGEDGMGFVRMTGTKYQAVQAVHKHKFNPRKNCYGRARIAFETYSADEVHAIANDDY